MMRTMKNKDDLLGANMAMVMTVMVMMVMVIMMMIVTMMVIATLMMRY